MIDHTPSAHLANDQPARTAGLLRFLLAYLVFLLVWSAVAFACGFVVHLLMFDLGGDWEFGIGLEWRNLPGTILGFLPACRAWRAIIGV